MLYEVITANNGTFFNVSLSHEAFIVRDCPIVVRIFPFYIECIRLPNNNFVNLFYVHGDNQFSLRYRCVEVRVIHVAKQIAGYKFVSNSYNFV